VLTEDNANYDKTTELEKCSKLGL